MPSIFGAVGELVKPSTAGTMGRMQQLRERIMAGDVFPPTDTTVYGRRKSLEEQAMEKARAEVAVTDYAIQARMAGAPDEVKEYALKLGKVIAPEDYPYVESWLKKQRGEELGTLEKTRATIWDSKLREFELKEAEEKRKVAESEAKVKEGEAKAKYYEEYAEYTKAGRPGKGEEMDRR